MAKLRLNETPGTNLMVSFLIRYPELASLRYNPETGKMSFTVLLTGEVNVERLAAFEAVVTDSFAVCRELERNLAASGLVTHSLMDGVTILTYEQQAEALHLTEIRLFIQLVRNGYRDLLGEDSLLLHEEDLEMQEHLIEQILLKKEVWRDEQPLVAYRDGGKVFVYNK